MIFTLLMRIIDFRPLILRTCYLPYTEHALMHIITSKRGSINAICEHSLCSSRGIPIKCYLQYSARFGLVELFRLWISSTGVALSDTVCRKAFSVIGKESTTHRDANSNLSWIRTRAVSLRKTQDLRLFWKCNCQNYVRMVSPLFLGLSGLLINLWFI